MLDFLEDVKFLECQVQLWPEENLEVRTDTTGPRGVLCFQYFSSHYLSSILLPSIDALSPPLRLLLLFLCLLLSQALLQNAQA